MKVMKATISMTIGRPAKTHAFRVTLSPDRMVVTLVLIVPQKSIIGYVYFTPPESLKLTRGMIEAG